MNTTKIIRDQLSSAMKYRNSDKLLRLKVWEQYGFNLTKEQMKIYWDLPADGAIARRRAEMRAEFPESKEVMDKRFERFKEEREKHSNGNWFARRIGFLR